MRCFSDASYWMYLVHLAPIAWCAGLLAQVPAPAFVKFWVVFAFTTFVTPALFRAPGTRHGAQAS